ncbi:hypothetical protein AvCA_40640 [Azotobacter vinelandii CA]|uniref:Uncharacterized protein n=2 Tax=Azotobacter vinelandii TaxID=354 RepID=C1DE91_AZOVD|nr:hypothetical protein Avin_40640 [Azotobacter vinelandii DJ]AGK16076.1 hypothetical protein AvCA_40640 [Azotobacter vinelandii CA]AGK21763.1 hypothetical protein AvCA6_40640 [Azotobacter vinelandii CA6]
MRQVRVDEGGGFTGQADPVAADWQR